MIPTLKVQQKKIVLRTEPSKQLSAELRERIPREAKEFDMRLKVWRISRLYIDEAKAAMFACWTNIAIDEPGSYRIVDRLGRETAQGSLF